MKASVTRIDIIRSRSHRGKVISSASEGVPSGPEGGSSSASSGIMVSPVVKVQGLGAPYADKCIPVKLVPEVMVNVYVVSGLKFAPSYLARLRSPVQEKFCTFYFLALSYLRRSLCVIFLQ